MERFKIYPSIGIARVGGSPNEFFLCPESDQSLGIEIDGTGNEKEIKNYKDTTGLIKRQGARFKVFELDSETGEYLPVDMSQSSVEWSVHLVNKKAAVVRPNEPPLTYSEVPLKLRTENPNELTINPGERKITGENQSGVTFADGKYKTQNVYLGELRTDKNGDLIVLGGNGVSKSPSNLAIGNYYYSKDWYDDTSDGFVKAMLTLSDGTKVSASSAWVIIAPPDYAPNIKGVVTLYDIMENVAIEKGQWQPVPIPSFVNHILPIIDRFKNLTWVSDYADYSINYDNAVLADTSLTNKEIRKEIYDKVLGIETLLEGHTQSGHPFKITKYQDSILLKWVDGEFNSDLANPDNVLKAADKLTKDVLDTTVGQGFCPGIEGGIIVKNPDIYNEAFRFDVSQVTPGDITGLMALPWQADFLKCNTNWWPTQRPDAVKLNNGEVEDWARGINNNHASLIKNFNKLGYIKPKTIGSIVEQIEDERSL